MFKYDNFTASANRSLNLAAESAGKMGHTYIGSEHILLGLVSEGSGVAFAELNAKNVSVRNVRDMIKNTVGIGSPTILTKDDLTPKAKIIIENSNQRAKGSFRNTVGTEHLLLSLVAEAECMGAKILRSLKVSAAEIVSDLLTCQESEMGRSASRHKKDIKAPSLLLKHGRDLTEMASVGEIDGVIGREKEIERTIRILSRRTKNNPCLIGDPGVGKTAIAEGLAYLIEQGKVPETLIGKRIIALDLTSVVAGTKYRGDFEERVKQIMEETKKTGNIILFIDEMHNLIGTGSAEGAVDAANILKPALARGEIQMIGATTIEEYRKNIEKDSALERRFQPIHVEEPTRSETLRILKGIKGKYEKHHNVIFADAALEAAVDLSVRYITDRFLPDKAIDLMDEAASECEIKGRSGVGRYVKSEDIAFIVSQWTGVPVSGINENEKDKLINLESKLKENIIGQDEAVGAVSKSIRRSRLGIGNESRPIGSFLFIGSSGVGKTELSKLLAKAVFGKDDYLIKFDMSECMESHSVSKLIGAPPGYAGYDEGGRLTEQVRRKPYSVVLFDEIEKAHKDIFNILLSILEDGEITDSLGVHINFKNTIIIITSNACSDILEKRFSLGFAPGNTSEIKKEVKSRLKKLFRPEFLNRLDDIILFNNLTGDDLKKISRKMLEETVKRIQNTLKIKLDFTDELVDGIAEAAEKEKSGARPVRDAIRNNVEDAVSDMILNGIMEAGGKYTVSWNKKQIRLLDRSGILL